MVFSEYSRDGRLTEEEETRGEDGGGITGVAW